MRIGIDARKVTDFGIGTYIRGLLRGLAECRGDEEYIVFAPRHAREHIPAAFEHHIIDAPHYSARELFLLGRAARAARVDVFHAPHYVIPITRFPVVVTIHDLIHLHVRHRNPVAPLYARTMIGRAVHRAARVLTVSNAVAREIEQRFGRSDVVVAPNGVDDVFRSPAPAATKREYFLYVGNDKPHKNVDLLVQAAGRVPGARLVLAGAPFERFHDREGIVAAGFVKTEELAALYRNAIALAAPSIDEGFGLPALEAMASGTAVITSMNEALIEVTGDAALHVDATSVADLASAMKRVADDHSLREELAQRGIERARAFTWKRCAEITRAAYIAAIAM